MGVKEYLGECWSEFWNPDNKPLQIVNFAVSVFLLLITAILFVWQNDIPQNWKNFVNNLSWIIPLGILVLYLLLVIPFTVANKHKNNWKKVIIERDTLIEKAKPKLTVVKKVQSIRGQQREDSIGLEVLNTGTSDALSCKGIVQLIEFAESPGGLSLFRWPQPQMLRWADTDSGEHSISGNLSAVLEIIRRDNDSNFRFAYSNPQERNSMAIPVSYDILIVIAVSSKDTSPLYSVCYFRIYSGLMAATFEIIASNTQLCPSIEDCRKIYEPDKERLRNTLFAKFYKTKSD